MNRTERLLDLIAYLLNAKEPVSWHEIKNHFPEDYARGVEESNQRKFERDKAELISLGIPIDYQSASENTKEGYLIREEKLFLPEVKFTAEESSLLMLSAGAVLENTNFPYRDQLESALHKITSINTHVNPPSPAMTITLPTHAKSSGRSRLVHQIQDALDRRKQIEIQYHAFSTGRITRRKLNPYGLIFRRGNWTLVSWDHLRQGLRCFVLTRISSLRVNPRKPGSPDYEIPADFSLKPYQNQQPWELEVHEPISVAIEVSDHRLPELRSQLMRAKQTGERTFEVSVTNRSGFVSWILSQKTDSRVLAPPEMISEIQHAMKNLL